MTDRLLQIIKIGSACLFREEGSIDEEAILRKGLEIGRSQDYNVLVVSGAIELGKALEGDFRDKSEMSAEELQGYAGIGQIELMKLYGKHFSRNIAQMLVTENNLQHSDELRRLIRHNLEKGRITLINYNDCVDFQELRKDNDSLAGDIFCCCNADRLIILGRDYDGFRDKARNTFARVRKVESWMYDCCKSKSKQGNGGFEAKLRTAEKVLSLGKEMIVSRFDYALEDIIHGNVGRTLFKA